MDYNDLGGRVRKLRKLQGMTQEQLAERVGISASFMGHIERGTRISSLETLVALCNALDVESDYLLAASLNSFGAAMPDDMNENERAKLSEFLRLAQDTVRNWNK